MTDHIRVVDFDAAHQDAAAALINTGLGERFGHIDKSMNPDLFDIQSTYSDGVFLLAFDRDLLVGTGSLMPVDEEVGQIARMHTTASYRRRGIASRVLDALEERARTRGFRYLVLETNIDWPDASAFYQRHGYRETHRDQVEVHYRKVVAD